MIPQLAGLQKKYADQSFHIVALECQGSSEDAIKKMAADKGVTYQMTVGGKLEGSNVRGIPHGFLFGPDGKLVADDPDLSTLEKKIKELIPEAAGAMAGPGPYTKLASLHAQVKSGKGLGTVLKQVRAKVSSADAAEAAEAKTMLEHLGGNAQKQLDNALALKDSDALACVNKLDKLALDFTGDEIGTKAKTESDALKKDPKVRKELDGAGMWVQVEKMRDGLKPAGQSRSPQSEAFRKMNLQAIQGMLASCQQIIQRYPGTAAAVKAQALVDEYK